MPFSSYKATDSPRRSYHLWRWGLSVGFSHCFGIPCPWVSIELAVRGFGVEVIGQLEDQLVAFTTRLGRE